MTATADQEDRTTLVEATIATSLEITASSRAREAVHPLIVATEEDHQTTILEEVEVEAEAEAAMVNISNSVVCGCYSDLTFLRK